MSILGLVVWGLYAYLALILLAAVAFVGATVALSAWLVRRARNRRETREKLIRRFGGVSSLAVAAAVLTSALLHLSVPASARADCVVSLAYHSGTFRIPVTATADGCDCLTPFSWSVSSEIPQLRIIAEGEMVERGVVYRGCATGTTRISVEKCGASAFVDIAWPPTLDSAPDSAPAADDVCPF